MTIRVLFPNVIKMTVEAYIEIGDCKTILGVKKKVFNTFWTVMSPHSGSPKHGSYARLILRDKEQIEIKSMAILKERIAKGHNFEAVFPEHQKKPNGNETNKS